MADRTRYLLAYDIREPRRLRRVHAAAKDFGEPLQYSVFVCDLTVVELIRLKERLVREMNLAKDSVGLFDLGAPRGRGLECVEFLGTRRPLPVDGPAVW
ncbi:MAG: CRISPR-associated endonuclease Cas2 [Solirubrobacteraceae bacterium]